MPLTLSKQATRPAIEARTHEASGVSVTFRRLGFVQKTRLAGDVGNSIGELFFALMQPGVGVQSWDGVLMPDGQPLPYSVKALDSVAEQVPGFGPWFNDNLLEVTGFDGGAAKDGKDAEGNSKAPASGSSAGDTTTPTPSTSLPD
jgi:hypothetical protein